MPLPRRIPGWAVIILWSSLPVSAPCQDQPTPKAVPPSAPLSEVVIYPAKIQLEGPRDEQRLAVLGVYADGRSWDLSRDAQLLSGDPKVAVVEQGVVRPVADGETVVTIAVAGRSQSVPVKVVRAGIDRPIEFTREIVPILTKAGCNMGACHGAQHGRGGFKLSLLGFDPLFDYSQIVQSAEGRRIVVSDPERSILLQKPILAMEHGGGERFKAGSREYRLLRRWLEDGVPEPSLNDPETAAIEIWPPRRRMVPGEQQQILVKAIWKDGRVQDVTATAVFDTLNDGVATVSSSGLVTVKGRGETHIMVRFCGQANVFHVTSPYAQIDPYPAWATNNFIDEKLLLQWKALGLTPSPDCTDEEFFRRIHLDAIGTLPTPNEVRAFLADQSPDKRSKAIDRVLERPEFVDFWALKFGDLLRISRDQMQERGMWSFHNWVRGQIRDKKPLDEMVRDIITAEGSTFSEGPANFYMTSRVPSDWAETASQLFLGVRIGCAKCHHHPFEKWSQDDYYGMTAFFVRLGTKPSQEFGLFGREQVVYLKNSGEQTHPRKGSVVKPRPLDGPEMTDPIDRRVKLAEWLTAPENPYFARNWANRFWGYLMGRGLVEPLDDVRATNPPSNPELLDALAQELVRSKFDMRHLLKTIMKSRAYQLSAKVTEGNQADGQNVHYARFTVRRLTAEQLADAIDQITGTQEKYPGLPLGTRAIQLPDAEVKSYFLDVFGRPPRQITCECERTTQPNIAQAMHLLNGAALNKKIGAASGRIETLLKAEKSPAEICDELYLASLGRLPHPDERQRVLGWLDRAPTTRDWAQDLLWVLLNSREFLFNH
ncbi:MAG: DUF1549 and DUF1553 domain-containing protein [Gemmataceae bacterium]|nr:DUF1549 and DUF1553 domain-containing protein [Gemmataceae bacterium]